MSESDFNVLAQRIDGVAWVLMSLIAQLEMDRRIDGPRFSDNLRNTAQGRGRYPGLDHSAAVIHEIAQSIEEARAARQSRDEPC